MTGLLVCLGTPQIEIQVTMTLILLCSPFLSSSLEFPLLCSELPALSLP